VDHSKVFDGAVDALWSLHSSQIRILILSIIRLMSIDMTFFQFIDWLLDILEDENADGDKKQD